jgi:hypothetical protein
MPPPAPTSRQTRRGGRCLSASCVSRAARVTGWREQSAEHATTALVRRSRSMGAAGEGALPQAAQTRGHGTDACINDIDDDADDADDDDDVDDAEESARTASLRAALISARGTKRPSARSTCTSLASSRNGVSPSVPTAFTTSSRGVGRDLAAARIDRVPAVPTRSPFRVRIVTMA